MESGGADISSQTQRPSNPADSSNADMEEVRAPIAPRQETLMGEDFGHDFGIRGEPDVLPQLLRGSHSWAWQMLSSASLPAARLWNSAAEGTFGD